MSLVQIFKKVIIPCAAGVSSAASAETHTYGPNCVKKAEPGTKPSDLPIYTKECLVCRKTESEAAPPSNVEETVGNIRRELWVWQDNLKGYRHKIVDVYRRGFSKADCPKKMESRNHLESSLDEKCVPQPKPCKPAKEIPRSTWSSVNKFGQFRVNRCGKFIGREPPGDQNQCKVQQAPVNQTCHSPPKYEESCRKNHCKCCAAVEYLREPAHGPYRLGAIAISGLSGYILAMRRGKFRRLLYGVIGAASMAAICYPEEAMEAVESVVLEGRRYFIIAYHFVYGETPKPPEWLEKFTEPTENACESKEEVEEKPVVRDCRCSHDPNNPRPCVLDCK